MATQVADAAHSADMEARAQRGAVTLTVGGAFTAAGQVSVEFLQDCVLMAQVLGGQAGGCTRQL